MGEHTYYNFILSPSGTLYRTNNQTGDTWILSGREWFKIGEVPTQSLS